SEAYVDRTGALGGVISVLDNGIDPAMYSPVPAAHGYLLHLVAANNQIIAFTETYSTKASAKRAITSCVHALTGYLDRIEANTGTRAVVSQGATGQFHYDLYAANGEIVLTSESYTSQAAAWNGEFAAKDAAAQPSSFQVRTATNGQ